MNDHRYKPSRRDLLKFGPKFGVVVLLAAIAALALLQGRRLNAQKSDYLSRELRARVTTLKAEAAAPADAPDVLLARLQTLWEWVNAWSLTGGRVPVDLPALAATHFRTLRNPTATPTAQQLTTISNFITRYTHDFKLLDETPDALGKLTLSKTGPFRAGDYLTFEQTWQVGALPAPFFKIPRWAYASALLLLAVAGWMAWRATSKPPSPQIVHTSPTPAPSPTPEIAPVLAQLNDGGSSLTLDAQGRLTGARGWPPEAHKAINVEPADVLRATCFVTSLADVDGAERMARRAFPAAALSFVQLQRNPARALVECETVARLRAAEKESLRFVNPSGLNASPNYSHVALVGAQRVVFSDLSLAQGVQEAEARLAFAQLEKALQAGGASIKDVAMSHLYPVSQAASELIRDTRFGFYDKSRPPASTLLLFEALPGGAAFGVEVVAPKHYRER
jgi:enamine deaminase RidA (YjgF/YER057c/UK114 family)